MQEFRRPNIWPKSYTESQSLKHSGDEDAPEAEPLEVTLGSTTGIIQLNSLSKSSLTIDDITLYPTPGPSELSARDPE
jgi:hypothetical protein